MEELVPFLIFWLIVGFVVGYAATTNGKDFLPWFIVYGYGDIWSFLLHLFTCS